MLYGIVVETLTLCHIPYLALLVIKREYLHPPLGLAEKIQVMIMTQMVLWHSGWHLVDSRPALYRCSCLMLGLHL